MMAANTEAEFKPATKLEAELADFHGKVSIAKALPYGIQHVLAMFVANLAPIAIICAAAGFDEAMTASLIQNAMIVAGIGTFVQLFAIWRIGSKLPIVMGVSFTFVTVLSGVAATYGYGTVMGSVIAGGLILLVLGLLAKYWRRFIGPSPRSASRCSPPAPRRSPAARARPTSPRPRTCSWARCRWWHAFCSRASPKAASSSCPCCSA